MDRRTWSTAAFVASLVALFLLTIIFRFAHLASGFPNDHFLFLAGAQQMLMGDWPTRDFLDPGFPLMFGAAALAQLFLGQTLFAEAVLVSLSFALAAVFTALAVRELTGSRVLAVLAALLEIAIVPRTYGYPKLLAYSAAVFLLQRYVTRPTPGRLLALAASIVTAFLFRHDHGVYLGIAGALAAWFAGPQGPWTARLLRSATLVGLVVLLASPYLVYVQANGGVWAYLQTGLEFRAAELRRQELAWPESFDEPLQAMMIYEYWAIPIVAWLLLFVRRHREDAGTTVARLAPILTVALLVNWTFLRSPFHTRLPDAMWPARCCRWGGSTRNWTARAFWTRASVGARPLARPARRCKRDTGTGSFRAAPQRRWCRSTRTWIGAPDPSTGCWPSATSPRCRSSHVVRLPADRSRFWVATTTRRTINGWR
jgi:hypothetical protein